MVELHNGCLENTLTPKESVGAGAGSIVDISPDNQR